jgi:hypothetical protein
MADAKITIVGGERVVRLLLETFGPRLREQLRHEVEEGAGDLRESVKARVRADFQRHTGDLERSIVASEVETSAHAISARVGSNEAYARIQEEGGTIKPREAQFLAIPLSAMLTGRGVARARARRVVADPGRFGYASTFFAHQLLFGRDSEGGIKPLFALRRQVTLTGRHYFDHAYKDSASALQERLAGAAQRALEEAAG